MSNVIKHSGRIISINENYIDVAIIDKSLCSECHASGICSASDQKIKTINIKNRFPVNSFSVGEVVDVVMRVSLGFKAVMLSYVIPLIIMLFLLLSLPSVKVNQLLSGVISLIAIAFYFLGLYCFRKKISGFFEFTIETK